MPDLSDIRKNYGNKPLRKQDLRNDPLEQLKMWLKEAIEINRGPWYEANAVSLATASGDGMPNVRTVLLKEIDHEGLIFYTNLQSTKARELRENPRAAIVFHWAQINRQVRVQGEVEQVSRDKAAEYFASRPRGSQLGAIVSRQSELIDSREQLESRIEEAAAKYDGRDVPMPEFWGGYRLVPDSIEFWQGRDSRLHDRLRYCRDGPEWIIERLSP